MVNAAILKTIRDGGNPTADAFMNTTKNLQAVQAENFRQSQLEEQAATQRAIDEAIRQSAMPAPMPAAQPLPQMQQAPVIQVQDLKPNSPVVSTPIPAAVSPSPAPGFASAPPSVGYSGVAQQPAAQQQVKLSPFDSPAFTQNLQARLAQIPGGGAQLLQMKKERDAQIVKVLEMAANGNADAARFMAKQNGLDIPDVMFDNSDVAAGMTLANKAYPDEPQKGQAFFKAFVSTQGGLQEKVNAGMQAGGAPTTASQRSLNNSIALLQYKAKNPQLQVTDPYKRYQNVGNVGLVDLAADGGPRVVIQGQRMTYQDALNKNVQALAGQMTTRTPQQLYEEAKKLTDMMYANGGGQPQPAPQAMPLVQQTPAAGFLTPPPVAGATPDANLFPQNQTPPATQQLPSPQSGGKVMVRNPKTGEAFELTNPTDADLAGAKSEGFEVVR